MNSQFYRRFIPSLQHHHTKQLTITFCFVSTFFATLLTMTTVGWTHKFQAERSLLFQVSEDRAEVMLIYYQPPGPDLDLVFSRFDKDRDGNLSDMEKALAAPFFAKRAFYALRSEFLNEILQSNPPDVKIERTKDKGIAVAFYINYSLENVLRNHTLKLSLYELHNQTIPIAVTVEPGENMQMEVIHVGEVSSAHDLPFKWVASKETKNTSFPTYWISSQFPWKEIFPTRVKVNNFNTILFTPKSLYFHFSPINHGHHM